ncbi:unnamed protein product [Lupinus luteus]|uniref:CCT domain-containing protein n=1 Tax=Lupinus luteus TaxID=3873 RepID=A0AAV1W374_LUPLU
MPLSPSLMASTPQFYSNNTFSTTDDITKFNSNTSVMNNSTIWYEDNMNFIPVYDHYGALNNHTVLQDWMPAISDCKMDEGGIGTFQNFSYGYQPHIGDFDEDIKPPNNATQNWYGIHGDQMTAGEESNNIKVERYSEEERKERIVRYLKKRNQRNFNKTIKYACRKTLADRRVRVRGRFARNNDLSAEDKTMKNLENNNNNHKEDLYGDHSIQLQLKIDDDDDWLYEAMANLVYLSHSSMDDI